MHATSKGRWRDDGAAQGRNAAEPGAGRWKTIRPSCMADPFANIAHGCNSVVATTTALKLADYVVTEAGFGADLGAEKFFDIKCRKSGLKPAAAVIVATVRALKMNGGIKKDELGQENVEALKQGCANLGRHIENIRQFGVPAVVAINHFHSDTEAEIQAVKELRRLDGRRGHSLPSLGRRLGRHRGTGQQGGGTGGIGRLAIRAALSRRHAALREDQHGGEAHLSRFGSHRRQVGALAAPAMGRAGLRKPAGLHGEDAVLLSPPTRTCAGAPTDHVVPVREVRLSAGAGFVVAVCGEIMTMPGLPKTPFFRAHLPERQRARSEGLF